jgi:DNA-binding NarL/FixJ family response regulator
MKKSGSIMIIDDDPVFTKLLSKALSVHSNNAIITCSSSLDIFNDSALNPSIVFIDYNMNDLNGLSTAKIVRRKWKKTTIILISESTKISSINVSKYGINGKIPKKIGVEQLASNGLRMNRVIRTNRVVKSLISYILSISFLATLTWVAWVFLG